MKARIAAAAVALCAAFGFATGAATAHAATTAPEPGVDRVTQSISVRDLDLASLTSTSSTTGTSQGADSTLPSAPLRGLVALLQEGLTLAGRDVLTETVTSSTFATNDDATTDPTVDNPAPPFEIPDLSQDPEENEGYIAALHKLGDAVDSVAAALSFLPGMSKLRESPAWHSDYVRIFGTLTLVSLPLLLVTIPVALVSALAVSVVVGLVVSSPAWLVGIALGVPWMALPAVLIGIVGVVLLVVFGIATPFWLLGGIAAIVVGSLAVAGSVATGPLATLGVPAGGAIIAAGIIMVFFGLVPLVPILIALGIIGFAIVLFLIPIVIGLIIVSPVGIPLFLLGFIPALVVTVPLFLLLAVSPVIIFALLAYALWKFRGPTRPIEGMPEPEKRNLDEEEQALKDNGFLNVMMETRDKTTKNPLNVIGDYMDWFWDDMQWALGQLPFVGPSLRKGINAMRLSSFWKSDLFRIGVTVALFSIVVIPALGVLASLAISAGVGVVVAIVTDLVLAIPFMLLGAFLLGVFALVGLIIVPVLFLASLAAIGMGIFFIVGGLALLGIGSAESIASIIVSLTGVLTALGIAGLFAGAGQAVTGGVLIALGILLVLAGIAGLILSIIPFIWVPLFLLFFVVGVLVFVIVSGLGMLLAAPLAMAVGAGAAALVALVLAPIAPIIFIPIGLFFLIVGLIGGAAIPTRPQGEAAPKITVEDDPDYQDNDRRRKGQKKEKHEFGEEDTTIPGFFNPDNDKKKDEADKADKDAKDGKKDSKKDQVSKQDAKKPRAPRAQRQSSYDLAA